MLMSLGFCAACELSQTEYGAVVLSPRPIGGIGEADRYARMKSENVPTMSFYFSENTDDITLWCVSCSLMPRWWIWDRCIVRRRYFTSRHRLHQPRSEPSLITLTRHTYVMYFLHGT